MKYKYIAWRAFRDVRIIDIISETDHYVTDSNGRKHKKISDDRSIFDTFEEAKQWLLDKEEADLRKATETISSIKEHIKRSHLPTNELAGMPPRLGACLYAKSREAYGRVTLLPD